MPHFIIIFIILNLKCTYKLIYFAANLHDCMMVRKYKRHPGTRQYANYGEEKLTAAKAAVQDGRLSLRKAHKEYGILLGTLSEEKVNFQPANVRTSRKPELESQLHQPQISSRISRQL